VRYERLSCVAPSENAELRGFGRAQGRLVRVFCNSVTTRTSSA